MKLDIGLKYKELGLSILNRTVWTNKKQYLSNKGDNRCLLCNEIENTEHLICSCPLLAEKIWIMLGKCIQSIWNINTVQGLIHTYEVMFNDKRRNIGEQQADVLLILIQTAKHMLHLKRYQRATSTTTTQIRYDEKRSAALWLNITEKNISYFGYKGDRTKMDILLEFKTYFIGIIEQ
jgi:hypothetical protein